LKKSEDKKEKQTKQKKQTKQNKGKRKKRIESNDDSTSNNKATTKAPTNAPPVLRPRGPHYKGRLRELPHVSYADEGQQEEEGGEDKKKKKEEKKTKREGKKGEKKYIMSPYELKIQENIKRNARMMQSLGLQSLGLANKQRKL
jgi:hypothetical protein